MAVRPDRVQAVEVRWMNSLSEDISLLQEKMLPQIPQDVLAVMQEATEGLKESELADQALKAGKVAPDFSLPELAGGTIRLSEALGDGLVVLSFYRGAWCPYCNLEMQALQRALPDIERAGGRLLAIAPELPEHAGEIRDKGNLTFALLHDRDHAVARAYGLVFTLPEQLRPIYEAFGIDLAVSQGNDRFELPMPATYIIARDGSIAHAFVDVDYTRRMEPAEIVNILETL